MNECPTRKQLESFLSGSLAGGDEEVICTHVDGCTICQAALESLVAAEPSTVLHRGVEAVPDEHFLERLKAQQPPPGWQPPSRNGAVLTPADPLTALPEVPGYEVIEEIGRGGMGIVYKARQVGLNRLTAVKMIYIGATSALDALARFRSEAEAVAALHHPNIIQIHEIGSHNGHPFFSMEYAENGTLRTRLQKRGLSPREAAAVIVTLARTIQYAHDCGIVHRDLKPANVLLTADETPKIADFGLAKRIDDDLATVTQTGRILGTPSYMAPEQASGRGNRAGPAVDIYALGAILYELLTGRPPFQGESFESTLNLILNAEPVALRKLKPGLPRDLDTVCLKCLEKDPKRRYLSAGALADDLDRFLAGQPVRARPVGPVERGVRWCRRNPALAAVWGGFVGALVLGLAGVSWKWVEAETEKNNVLRAEQKTRDERDHANAARDESKRLTAGTLLDKGIDLAEKGNVAEGMFWLLESIQAAPEDDRGLRRAARLNLAAWMPMLHGLRQTIAGSFIAMSISPDGRRLATGNEKGDVQVWDMATGRPIAPPNRIGKGYVTSLTFCRDGKSFFAAFDDRIQRCDGDNGQPVGEALLHPDLVHAAALSPDGTRLASACEDGVVRLWDVVMGKLLTEPFRDTRTHPVCLAFSPDGKTLAVGTARSYETPSTGIWKNGGKSLKTDAAAAHLIDVSSGRSSEPLPHKGMVNRVTFSGDGRRLLTACTDGSARVWDVASNKAIGSPLTYSGEVLTAAFTPDSTAIVTGYGVGRVGGNRWWDAATGLPLAGSLPRHNGHEMGLEFTADGRWLTTLATTPETGGAEGEIAIRIWQTARSPVRTPLSRTDEATLPTTITNRTQFSSNCQTALSWDLNDRVVRLWDLETGRPRGAPIRCPWPIRTSAITPDGSRAVITSFDKPTAAGSTVIALCQIIDVNSNRLLFNLPHSNWVFAVAFTPDGSLLATGGYDRCVHLWETATGRLVGAPWRQGAVIESIALSPDGRTIAVSHNRTSVCDLSSHMPRGPELPAGTICFSPDRRLLASSDKGLVRLWDANTCQSIEPNLTAYNPEESQITFSADGTMLLTDGINGAARLWDVASGQQHGLPLLYTHAVTSRAFSPDSQCVLLGYVDGTARVWDLATHKTIGPPMRPGGPVHAAAFTPDGHFFFTAAGNGPPQKHRTPQPLDEEDLQRVRLRLEVRTGLAMMEGGFIAELPPHAWRERCDRLRELEGSTENANLGALGERDWHEVRARDAEADGDGFAARWHLDRLLIDAQDVSGTFQESPSDVVRSSLFSISVRQARIHSDASEFDLADADYAAALRHGGTSALLDWYNQRAAECVQSAHWTSALWYLERLIAAKPNEWEWYAARAEVHDRLGRAAEREADLDRAIQLGAGGAFLLQLGGDYARRDRWDKAIACFNLARERGPLLLEGWREQALAQLRSSDIGAYGRLCRSLIAEAESISDVSFANEAAWMFVLGPNAVDDYERVLRLLSKALQPVPGIETRRPAVLNTLGAALYRAGRYREAIDTLHEGMLARDGNGTPDDWVFLAMAHQQLGHTIEAKRWLEQVKKKLRVNTSLNWNSLELSILYREAETMIAVGSKD